MQSVPVRKCALTAIAATALVFTWMAFVVHYADGSNWTALFCIGDRTPEPPELQHDVYRWPNSGGYDGAFYRTLAHDPWLRRGFAHYVDGPRLRFRRILVPALAWTLGGGRDSAIDAGYIAAMLAFVAAGAFWVAEHAAAMGRSALWGLAYLLLPSTIISIDRMLTDLPLISLLAGFLWYARKGSFAALWILGLLACLTRETGVCIVVGYAAWLLTQRLYARAALMLTAMLPLLVWILYVNAHTTAGLSFWTTYVGPARDLLAAIVHLRTYPVSPAIQVGIQILDKIALAGIVLGFVQAILLARRGGPQAFIILAFVAVSAILTSMNDQFADVYGYGRLFSPVLLILAWDALASRRWLEFAPTLMILGRTLAIPIHETVTAFAHVRL